MDLTVTSYLPLAFLGKREGIGIGNDVSYISLKWTLLC
jgi:hypothetical protein